MTGPRAGSHNHKLSQLAVGEAAYFETGLDYSARMRSLVVDARRSAAMKDWRFTASLFTCVGAGRVGEIIYLIRVVRVA